jgi:hypothetical protein
MNISLTKQELVMLLRLANIGDWVMFADLEGDERDNPTALAHKKVMQKLFAAAHKAKMDNIVHYEAKFKEYFETSVFEDDYQEFINEYNERKFWDDLSDQLAKRDLIEQIGEEAFEAMDWVERGGKLCDLSISYEKEFEKHGLERLQILNTSGRGNA